MKKIHPFKVSPLFLPFLLCLCLFLWSSSPAFAKAFQFSIGDTIHVSSDKGYRYGGQNKFEVLGNVVILHLDEALYGESGSLELDTGQIEVKGNVRYIGPEMTMYGSQLSFNAKSGYLSVRNARILGKGYSVQGEHMIRLSPKVIVAEDAEYTTCRDCPESWSVYGKKVKVTLGEYIHITHALIKVNQVSIMYLPYMVLPIKRKRQTGLLFPQFSLSFRDGFNYRQPWFWAIGDSNDMTLVPWSKGKRGLGNEIEYRHILGEGKWFDFHSLQANDRIYTPNKPDDELSGEHYLRHFSDYEHHYQIGNFFNHHFMFQKTRDLDTLADYASFTRPRLEGTEMGGGGFINMKNTFVDFNVEGYTKRNLIVPDARQFDKNYVQIMPRTSLDFTPVSILHTPYFFLQNISLGANGTHTLFRQNHISEGVYIRNAHRFTANPYIDWTLGKIGPVDLKTNIQGDYQHYRFPYEGEKTFNKRGTVFTSDITFEIDKIFGMAYSEKIPINRIELPGLSKTPSGEVTAPVREATMAEGEDTKEEPLIGDLPSFENSYIDDHMVFSQSGYRHSMIFNLRHHYTSDQAYSGNSIFQNQIENANGLFDYQDAPRKLRHVIGSLSSRTDISQRNTLEFRLFNSLFKKESRGISFSQDELYLRDHFSYTKLAYIDLSQGIELRTEEPRFIDNLTRLYLTTGFPLLGFQVAMSDYYFYQTRKHLFVGNLNRDMGYFGFGIVFRYNQLVEPPTKTADLRLSIRPWSTVQFQITHSQDLAKKVAVSSNYSIGYSPWNNCWKLDLGYSVTPEDRQITFNFLVNFGENKFTSLLAPVGGAGG